MGADGAIVERWVERTLESYPAEMLPFLSGEQDPFRNPVGHTLRENLATLVQELLGAMDKRHRARAGRARPPARRAEFQPCGGGAFRLRAAAAVRGRPARFRSLFRSRIDELALMAFDQYMICREQIFELRVKELRLECAVRRVRKGGTP